MITVKAFEKGLKCLGFQYKVGRTYTMPTEKVDICNKGFHAVADCNISNTLKYYPVNSEYCLVDVNVIDKKGTKVVGDRITILKKLTFNQCIKYDKTGEWCYYAAKYIKGANIQKLQDAVIEKDKGKLWCYNFAKYIKGANIQKLQKAIIEYDKTGEWCYYAAKYIKGANIQKLQDAVIEKDKTGEWCYRFADSVKNANILKLQNAIIKKDKTGEWCYNFALFVINVNIQKLEDNILLRDKTGKWIRKFIDIHEANINRLQDDLKRSI